MPTIYQDLDIDLGATFAIEFTVWTSYLERTPKDLGGASARMQVREDFTSGSTILDLDSTSEIALGGSAGTITVTIPASTLAALRSSLDFEPLRDYPRESRAVYDLELEEADGTVTRIAQGRIRFLDEVTR